MSFIDEGCHDREFVGELGVEAKLTCDIFRDQGEADVDVPSHPDDAVRVIGWIGHPLVSYEVILPNRKNRKAGIMDDEGGWALGMHARERTDTRA